MTHDFAQKLLEAMRGEPLETMPEFSKDSLQAIYASAYCYYQSGKYQEAKSRFRFLATMDTENRTYWLGLGASLMMLKEYEQALQAYALAAMMDHSDPLVFIHMADCLFALGKVEEGLKCIAAADQISGKEEKFKSLKDHINLIQERWSTRVANKG